MPDLRRVDCGTPSWRATLGDAGRLGCDRFADLGTYRVQGREQQDGRAEQPAHRGVVPTFAKPLAIELAMPRGRTPGQARKISRPTSRRAPRLPERATEHLTQLARTSAPGTNGAKLHENTHRLAGQGGHRGDPRRARVVVRQRRPRAGPSDDDRHQVPERHHPRTAPGPLRWVSISCGLTDRRRRRADDVRQVRSQPLRRRVLAGAVGKRTHQRELPAGAEYASSADHE